MVLICNLKSRRALRALKGLVKLQALVRGHIIRRQTADYLRQMQAISRAQSRARAGRSQVSGSPHSSTKSVQFVHVSNNNLPFLQLYKFEANSYFLKDCCSKVLVFNRSSYFDNDYSSRIKILTLNISLQFPTPFPIYCKDATLFFLL